MQAVSWALMAGLWCAGPAQAQPKPLVPEAPVLERAPDAPRPRVGLVLGGGGARGAAHIGVLEVLERLNVPVDCVAGTSMGALVAGAWAAGLTPKEMREQLAAADWPDMFQDNPAFAELNFRTKRLSQRFFPGSETGITERGAVAPPGVVSGQKIKLFINQLVRADTGERVIEALPLPLSIIATDIGTGDRVTYTDGSLTQAMRASMAVPGLLSPVEYRGRKLVDGGLVDNVPIAEVRRLCDAERVIVVNVGSPLLAPENVVGLLSISAQMVALLTEQNVSRSLASLLPTDIYIQPDLGNITAGAFDRHAEAADRGRAAAEAESEHLAALSVPAPQFAAWRHRLEGRERPVPRVDEIEVAGLGRVNPEAVERYLRQPLGEPLDTQALNRDLLRAYGDGYYEGVDYSLTTVRGRNVLRVTPVEKSWGPDYLRLALALDSNLSQGSTYRLRAAYQKTWLNSLGAELLFTGEIGSTSGVGVEFFQPLDPAQRFFVDTAASYRRERLDLYFRDQRVAEYSSGSSRVELTAGIQFSLVGQLRAGWRETRRLLELETGEPLLPDKVRVSSGGWLLALDMDQLDQLYVPRSGWALNASLFDEARRDFTRVDLDLRTAWTAGDYVLGTRWRAGGPVRGRLPLDEAATLGGFLNLTAYARDQLRGESIVFGQLRAERIIGRAPLGLRGDMRFGVALEAGRVERPFLPLKRDGWLGSVAVYLGGETPFGPVYLGLGHGSGGSTNAYLVIGIP
jgi:NTE family protein